MGKARWIPNVPATGCSQVREEVCAGVPAAGSEYVRLILTAHLTACTISILTGAKYGALPYDREFLT